jgi:hypothetical protein
LKSATDKHERELKYVNDQHKQELKSYAYYRDDYWNKYKKAEAERARLYSENEELRKQNVTF